MKELMAKLEEVRELAEKEGYFTKLISTKTNLGVHIELSLDCLLADITGTKHNHPAVAPGMPEYKYAGIPNDQIPEEELARLRRIDMETPEPDAPTPQGVKFVNQYPAMPPTNGAPCLRSRINTRQEEAFDRLMREEFDDDDACPSW